jgi:hypothetical protein
MTITFIDVDSLEGTETHAIIENADGSFTSMLQSTYEAQQAEQSTPMIPGDE